MASLQTFDNTVNPYGKVGSGFYACGLIKSVVQMP